MAPVATSKAFRVHLTGFGPFRDVKDNPSTLATAPLHNSTLDAPPPPFPSSASAASTDPRPAGSARPTPRAIFITTTESIPVTYPDVSSAVHAIHRIGAGTPGSADSETEGAPYDLILHVGVGHPGALKLEQRGRRYGYGSRDAANNLAPELDGKWGYVESEWDGVAAEGAEGEELRTRVHGEVVRKWVVGQGVEHLRLSEDAGLFLCEFICFGSLAAAKRTTNAQGETLVQFLHIPAIGSPYSLEELTHAISLIVWAIVNEGGLP